MVTKAKPKGPIVFKELTPEEQIAEIRREAAQKIKELETQLPWEKRFSIAFNQYVKTKSGIISGCIDGYKPDNDFEATVNIFLKERGFKLIYDSATFDNELYNKSGASDLIDDCDLSEYPVYAVFIITDLDMNTVGHIKIKCNYSSYNGNEYSNWQFVKPQEITCTIYNVYQP